MNWILILIIVVIVILVILYATKKISGSTLTILILLLIILILLVPSLIGIGTIGFLGQSCQNQDCSLLKLPFDITKKANGGPNFDYYNFRLKNQNLPFNKLANQQFNK